MGALGRTPERLRQDSLKTGSAYTEVPSGLREISGRLPLVVVSRAEYKESDQGKQ